MQRYRRTALFLAFVYLVLSACTASAPVRRPPRISDLSVKHTETPYVRSPVAPWQTWSSRSAAGALGDAALLGEAGRLREEEEAYRALEREAASPEVRFEAFVRRMGTMLKSGRSREVLGEVAQKAASQGKKIEELGPRLALTVAFAYQHERDVDQTFAWLSLASRLGGAKSDVGRRAREEATRLIRRIRADAFERYTAHWTGDPFMSELFARERAHRAEGRQPDEKKVTDWFSVRTYTEGQSAPVEGPATMPAAERTVIGVLLPLSGQFQEHALRVQRGIDLAVEQWDPERRVEIVYRDTGGQPEGAAREYDALVRERHAVAFLGPLLVREAEAVAERSRSAGIPFLTFTKRSGLTALSPVTFRLGATAENQLREAIGFAHRERNIAAFASIASGTGAAAEFLASFRNVVAEEKGEVLSEITFTPGDTRSIEQAVEQVRGRPPGAAFFPDGLDAALPVVTALRSVLPDLVILGPASWEEPVFIRGYGSSLEGVYFVTPFFSRSQRGEVGAFSKAYQARYGTASDLLGAQAFDATRLLLEALHSADSLRRSFAEGLRSLAPIAGVTGELRVMPTGEIVRRMSVVEIRGGEMVEVFSAGVTTGYVAEGEPDGGAKAQAAE